jgi:hypothetical protein
MRRPLYEVKRRSPFINSEVVVGFLGWHQTTSEKVPEVERRWTKCASRGAGSKNYIKLPVDKTGERVKDVKMVRSGGRKCGRWTRGGGVNALCD